VFINATEIELLDHCKSKAEGGRVIGMNGVYYLYD